MRTTSILFFTAAVQAISVTSPTKDEEVTLGSSSVTVTWERVESDPTTAHLVLVNQVGGHTPYSNDLGSVDLTTGSYTVGAISGISADSGYQFNLVSTSSGSSGILAQSNQFTIVEGSSSSESESSSSESATSTTTVSGSTSTGSATTTGTASSSTASTTGTSSSSSATTLTTATSSSTSTASSSANGTTTASSSSATQSTSAGHRLAGGSVLALAILAATALLA